MPIPREFLRKDKIRAIVKITNLKTDEMYLEASEDAVKSFSSIRFKLDLGIHPNKSLQKAYTELGLELFLIEIDVEADDTDDLSTLLEKRKAYYLEKGNRLYT